MEKEFPDPSRIMDLEAFVLGWVDFMNFLNSNEIYHCTKQIEGGLKSIWVCRNREYFAPIFNIVSLKTFTIFKSNFEKKITNLIIVQHFCENT